MFKRRTLAALFLLSCSFFFHVGCSSPTTPSETHQDGGSVTPDSTSVTNVPVGCQPGTAGCRCTPTGMCGDALRCESNVCRPCSKGSSGCACDGDTCDAGLTCSQGICLGCVGKANCPCFGNNSCETGNRCKPSPSSIGQCEACTGPNKEDCNCEKDEECGGGMGCINNRCKSTQVLAQIPKQPKCYTPCEGDVRDADGSIRICHTKFKLMEGCAPEQTCQEGSCVSKNDAAKLSSNQYPFCLEDIDCPDWQACIEGRCYSNCASDADCKDGRSCFRYVCRRKCSTQNNPCGAQESCETEGREDGVCVPRSNRNGPKPPQKKLEGTYKILNQSLTFSNHETSAILYVRNNSAFPTEFTVSRVSHTLASSTSTEKPLFWLKIDLCKTYSDDGLNCTAFAEAPSANDPFQIPSVQSDQMVILKISNAGGMPSGNSSYQGVLKISNRQMGDQEFSVSYRETGDGQWKGRFISFANFNDQNVFDTNNKSKMIDDGVRAQDLPNALLRQWLSFKRGGSLEEFRAALRSIREGTWNLPQVRKDCKTKMSTEGSADVVCYPYATKLGYKVLSFSDREAPVPSGISELNFAINVKEKSGNVLEGRIVTSEALQYPGNPQIRLTFNEKPGEKFFTQIQGLQAVIPIGGRYYVNDKNECLAEQGFVKQATPWLIPGFTFGSFPTQGLFRESYECRSASLPQPLPEGADEATRQRVQEQNMSLSQANPVPNGWLLNRKLELVDGALVQNRYMILLVRERFDSFFALSQAQGGNQLVKDFASYGIIFMERTPADLEPEDFTSAPPTPPKTCSSDSACGTGGICVNGECKGTSKLWRVACTPELVKEATGKNIAAEADLDNWTQGELDELVATLLQGQSKNIAGDNANLIRDSGDGEFSYTDGLTTLFVHYYCEDAKIFNGGADNATACPIGSKVVFFEIPNMSTAALQTESCQRNGDCSARFEALKRLPGYREDVTFNCADSAKIFCDDDRTNMRKGKIFFKKPSKTTGYVSPFNSLRAEMVDAFRYRLKFTSRDGTNVGFTPNICSTNSQLVPYCYDPERIEKIERRINCLQALYTSSNSQKMSESTRAELRSFLEFNFSYKATLSADGALLSEMGFETLNAELKIMLGDEAFIQAFASRYDLAGSRLASFDGAAFEPNGISLSGALGFEMHSLYLSAQYYQIVLDRFFTQSKVIFQSFQSKTGGFITVESVSSYFQKLLLASTRKARSWSQIAKRYHKLNRADIARHVVERAYVSTFLEMQFMTRLLRELAMVTDAKKLDDIKNQIDKITLTYKSALLDMEEVYKELTLEINFLGIPKGHIPFPALDVFSASTLSTNAFSVALNFAKEKMGIAAAKEQLALQNKRVFDTDAASFQSELVRIRQNYESQLLEICGGIQVGDKVFPATTTYAYLTPETLQMGNPCGRVSGGQLFEAFANLEKTQLGLKSLRIAQDNVRKQITIEEERIQKYCDAKFKLADFLLSKRDESITLDKELRALQFQMERVQRLGQDAVTIGELLKCSVVVGTSSGGSCPTSFAAIATVVVAAAAREGAMEVVIRKLQNSQSRMKQIEKDMEARQLRVECEGSSQNPTGLARIESAARIQELTNQTLNFQLEALKAELDIRTAFSNIIRLQQRAQRLTTEQDENEQLTINVQAARNDPNIRIYKNDAIINAERTFEEALREAYRATLIYEYYTGQTYKHRGDLFLIRMIAFGDKNLEAYLSQLEQAFREFEETNGKPDLRVLIVSLKNDILNIPRSKGEKNNEPRSINERNADFQRAITDPNRLNNEGYYAFPFALSVGRSDAKVSPITVNHKIVQISAEVIGGDNGDEVARVYLRQKGTSVVRLRGNDQTFYTLPVRTAVINPFFNGAKVLEPNLYNNFRLRDRPLGNTHWELLFNHVTEQANQDIDLTKVNDIKLYIYYSDFTEE
ncbi:MAG: hypothetical protein H6728_02160 [Myxococcales bacterium]|nr:hypothetical protein [Myxococcales bacterium]MCB9641857.1 hypothetical protein [Myxococcales bacterium]